MPEHRAPPDYQQPAEPPDLPEAMRRALLLSQGGQPAKMAIIGLYQSAVTPTEALAAHLALGMLGLMTARSVALTAQLVCGQRDPRRPCEVCDRVCGTVVSTDSTADVAAPLACPRLLEPSGKRRVLCNVMVNAWVKRADGTMYLDRRPTFERSRLPMTAEQIEQARVAWSRVLGFELPKADGGLPSGGSDGSR
jgi:hypothetical protein